MMQNFPPLPPRPPRTPGAYSTAVIALGSNLGDRHATIMHAAERIARLPLVEDLQLSTLHETVALRPDGPDPDAPAYVNAVATIRTRLAPHILLGMLHAIEEEFGRERTQRWGDRTLDLDLVAYGDERSDDPELQLPHPRAADRLFVLEPWAELDPDATLPAGRIRDLIENLRGAQ